MVSGFEDCVKCHQCGGGLRNWLPDDNPWVEHAKWFPTCEYVLISKGTDFVSSSQGSQSAIASSGLAFDEATVVGGTPASSTPSQLPQTAVPQIAVPQTAVQTSVKASRGEEVHLSTRQNRGSMYNSSLALQVEEFMKQPQAQAPLNLFSSDQIRQKVQEKYSRSGKSHNRPI